MRVRFSPNKSSGLGCTSFMSWGNPELVDFLLRRFRPQPGEELVEIVADPEGLIGVFQTKDSNKRFERV